MEYTKLTNVFSAILHHMPRHSFIADASLLPPR